MYQIPRRQVSHIPSPHTHTHTHTVYTTLFPPPIPPNALISPFTCARRKSKSCFSARNIAILVGVQHIQGLFLSSFFFGVEGLTERSDRKRIKNKKRCQIEAKFRASTIREATTATVMSAPTCTGKSVVTCLRRLATPFGRTPTVVVVVAATAAQLIPATPPPIIINSNNSNKYNSSGMHNNRAT